MHTGVMGRVREAGAASYTSKSCSVLTDPNDYPLALPKLALSKHISMDGRTLSAVGNVRFCVVTLGHQAHREVHNGVDAAQLTPDTTA